MVIVRAVIAAMLAGATVFASSASAQAGKPSALEQRIIAKLTADPGLAAALAGPPPQMAKVAPLVGSWEVKSGRAAGAGLGTSVVTSVFGGRWLETRGAYPGGMQNVGFLGYNPGIRKWQSVTMDNFGNSNTLHADDWVGDTIVFEGDITALGVQAHVRETVTKVSDDEFRVLSEERIDGAWHRIDEHQHRRASN